ncbi:MAG: hypothetical protein V1809_10470 [Planctomycetota bacterium]
MNESNGLWTVLEVAKYLGRSPRWIWSNLRRPETETGSIPHYRLPGGGRPAPRFDPGEVVGWVRAGCPPVSVFRKSPNNRK